MRREGGAPQTDALQPAAPPQREPPSARHVTAQSRRKTRKAGDRHLPGESEANSERQQKLSCQMPLTHCLNISCLVIHIKDVRFHCLALKSAHWLAQDFHAHITLDQIFSAQIRAMGIKSVHLSRYQIIDKKTGNL